MTVLGSNTFGVELHSVHRPFSVPYSHDDPLVRLGSDFEVPRQALPLDDKRMIARRLEVVRDIGEDAITLVPDARQLAMHQSWRPHHPTAEGLADRLMPEADAEN